MKTCIHCGASIPARAKFCQKCGQSQDAPLEASQDTIAAAAPAASAVTPEGVSPKPPVSVAEDKESSTPVSKGKSAIEDLGKGAPVAEDGDKAKSKKGGSQNAGKAKAEKTKADKADKAKSARVKPAKAEGAVATAEKKSKTPVIITLVALALVAILAISAVLVFTRSNQDDDYARYANLMLTSYTARDPYGDFSILFDNGSIVNLGESNNMAYHAFDQSLVLALEDTGTMTAGGHALYHVAIFNEKSELVFSDQNIYNFSFNQGTKVLYYQKEGRSGGLFQIEGSNQRLVADAVDHYVPSPSDDYVLYVLGTELYSVQPGKAAVLLTSVPEGTEPLGISGDGDIKFIRQPTGRSAFDYVYTCLNASNTANAVRVENSEASIVFNLSGSQAVLSSNEGIWVCQNGLFTQVADNGAHLYTASYPTGILRGIFGHVLPVQNFDTFGFLQTFGEDEFYQNLMLYYNGTVSQVADHVEDVQANSSCSIFVYTQNNALRRVIISNGTVGVSRKVVDNPAAYLISYDGRNLYYVLRNNGVGSIYHLSGDGTPQLINDNLSYFYACSHNGAFCAYIANYDADRLEGDLYLFEAGQTPILLGKASRILDVNDSGNLIYTTGRQSYEGEGAQYLSQLYFYSGGSSSLVEEYMFEY